MIEAENCKEPQSESLKLALNGIYERMDVTDDKKD